MLEDCGIQYLINPINRKLQEAELASLIGDCDVLIAGTEPITDNVLAHAPKLKLISRVGIGLDSIDLLAAERRGVLVSYTPDAPTDAVAELTIGLILAVLRSVHVSNMGLHVGEWHRYLGRRLSKCTVGIIGFGRIGSRVLQHLCGFECNRILLNDVDEAKLPDSRLPWEWQDKETIYREADVITFHVPLTATTRHMIGTTELEMMKPDAVLINTSRGGIIDEDDLFCALSNGHLGGAAIDVFETEPYAGPLSTIDRCLLTAHMGSMSEDCRVRMEIEATEEAVRFLTGQSLAQEAPVNEY